MIVLYNLKGRYQDRFCLLEKYAILFISLIITFPSVLSRKGEKSPPPNILLLLTDDQDSIVGGMAHMPQLQRLLKDQGVTFANGFVHTPICCPSRSSILSGRYLHNGGALNNTVDGNCYGQEWKNDTEQNTFAALLQNLVGYRTSYAGKYLNQYGIPGSGCFENGTECDRVPPGWDRWLGLVGNSKYYNYEVVVQKEDKRKRIEHHGDNYEKDYFPDLVANFTLESIQTFATDKERPFLAVVAWPTAHAPYTPAPWSEHRYDDLTALRTPNYNASLQSLQSKHWMMRWLAPIDNGTEFWMNEVYQNRTEGLLSVDHHIQLFIDALKRYDMYDNTYILYTSDNGWQLGQHRLSYDKRQLYENDIRVPFVLTGPGIPHNVTCNHIVLNIDIAPTIVDMATKGWSTFGSRSMMMNKPESETLRKKQLGHALDQMDGASFLPSFAGKMKERMTIPLDDNDHYVPRTDFLISYHGHGYAQCDNFWSCPGPPSPKDYHCGDWSNNTYHCIRTIQVDGEDSIYCRFMDEEHFGEYYDLKKDPWQLHNTYSSLSINQQMRYEKRLQELRTCQGKTCRHRKLLTNTE